MMVTLCASAKSQFIRPSILHSISLVPLRQRAVCIRRVTSVLIAMEINAWLEPARLPLVIAATPKASKWLADRRRGGADPPPKT